MANALADEKSPYLLQHADNPVAWLPWGEVAFAKSRAEQKPIFLSIGYSTCHWCHVMAHESFENETIAKILNEYFVPVKVDREERPDVDKVYMAYVQAMTGHGGWPLSAWLTPELKPFYGGTYFAPDDRQGRAGFPAILRAIARGWETERDKLVAESERILETLREHYCGQGESAEAEPRRGESSGSQLSALSAQLFESAGQAFEKGFQYFYEAFDATNAGFGGAPKFPRASNLNFLFRIAALQGTASDMGKEAIRLCTATLRAMARGGIHDHVGGGFHRYSVDEAWFVPHFEKMLYDQAQIALNCLEARQASGDERFAWLARDILGYVRRGLTGPAGGFFTAEDADSVIAHGQPEHAEGAFYVWTADELRRVLGDEATFFGAHFSVEENGNVPAQLDPHREFGGKNILVQRRSLTETARQFALSPEQANERLIAALDLLRGVRSGRPAPHLDDKVLTANNGLMISALAKAHQVLGGADRSLALGVADDASRGRGHVDFLSTATRAAEFVARDLYDDTRGVLFRTWRGRRGATEGFAEDYAFFVQGLLDLYEASFDVRWLRWAERLQLKMDELFWDDGTARSTQQAGGQAQGKARGGYFNSAAGDASIVLRLKEDYDGAEPAPSSVAAMNLFRLSAMLNVEAFRERGMRCIDAFRPQWTKSPHAMPQMLCALEFALEPPRHVVIAGDPEADDFRALVAVVHERLGARRVLLAADGGEGQRWLAERAPWLMGMKPLGGRATAYVCEEFACKAPVSEPADLRRALN